MSSQNPYTEFDMAQYYYYENPGAKRRRVDATLSLAPDDTCTFMQLAPCPTSVMSYQWESQVSVPFDLTLSSASLRNDEKTVVCFGRIPRINGRCGRHKHKNVFPVALESSERFIALDGSGISGSISLDHNQMIQSLLEEKSLQLYASCTLDTEPTKGRSTAATSQILCLLEITVYGPFELFEEFGPWFQDYDVYLQDPQVCHQDVKYCNPQRLSSSDIESCPFVSQIVSKTQELIHLEDIVERPEPLDILGGQDNLEEAPQPVLIRASLHRHQKQALTFMLHREKGWAFDREEPDIWETFDSGTSRYFINRVSHQHQLEDPLHFSGGIIADPMGLGKTLTMIALAANDLDSGNAFGEDSTSDEESQTSIQATLIVVPQPLLGTWEEQLSDHVVEGGMAFRRHHGKSRVTKVREIESVNVVLTTYHTLSADWKASRTHEKHLIFSAKWRRVILDEAHVIRNLKSRLARAVCDLDAESRWAVTGTPIQNHLSDLAALLKFIRVHPYDEPKRFDTDIARLWKSGEDEEAVKRLKCLSRCLILRRAKKTLDLPPRRDLKCPIDFSKAERKLYDVIRGQAITKIDDVLLHESEISTTGIYVNFLQQIESMRLICDLGLHYRARHDKMPSSQASNNWTAIAQQTFNIQREMHPMACYQCLSILDMNETASDNCDPNQIPQFSQCLKYACGDCLFRSRSGGLIMACGHNPQCPVAPVSINVSASEETLNPAPHHTKPPLLFNELPSKVQALIHDLKALPFDVKSIVFSTWRLTLDIIEAGLNQAGIQCVRFDGKVPQAQRQPVLNQFKCDPNMRVMLLTLQCGAVGLTLTEASRAYLMEPHWNPTIEEQALARIHRIGQTREVTTVRFYIRDSFEEKVMEVQDSKKNLAGVLLSGHDGGQADDSLGALQLLRSLL